MIREATVDDAAEIARIQVAGWTTAYRGIMPDSILDAMTVEKRTTRWIGNLTEPDSSAVTLVHARDGRIVGFASHGPCRDSDADPDTGEIWAVYVEPSAWGNGVGKALLDRCLARLWDDGATRVTLWVLRDNSRARRFYEHAGFVTDGGEQHSVHDGDRVPEVRYVLDAPRTR